MIELDRCLQAPVEFHYTQAEYRKILSAWEGAHHFERLDSITSSEVELDRMVDVLREMDDVSADLVLDAAIPEFELIVREAIPSVNLTAIRFKKSALVGRNIIHEGKNGAKLVYTPIIDMYISFQQTERVDVISTIYVMEGTDGKTNTRFTGTANINHWYNSDSPLYESLVIYPTKEMSEIFRDIKLIYVALQRAFKYRPEIFYTSSEKTISPVPSGKRHGKPHKNCTRVVKMIRTNMQEIVRYAAPVKHMTCPCWGVIGHMRTYKSGKQVWIAPYRKGRERNNPAAYVPKEYVMEG